MKDPAVLFYISDWLTSTAEMDADCRGWYLNLILHNYDKGSVPNDIEKLGVLCNVKFSEFERFKQVFEQMIKDKFEQTEDGRLTNGRTSKILQGRELFKDKRSDAGKWSYFYKNCYNIDKKAMTKGFKTFLQDNLDISTLDTKNKQMLEQVFKQMLELYRNEIGTESKVLDLSLVEKEFLPIIKKWLEYKKEKNQTYKKIGFEQFYKTLLKFSKNNPQKAIEIIEFSMSNNYSGIFEPKENVNKLKPLQHDTDYD